MRDPLMAHRAARAATLRDGSVRCAAAFLAVAATVLAVGGFWWFAVLDAVLFAALVWSLSSRSAAAGIVADFAPILAATAIAYGEVPAFVSVLGAHYRDQAVQGLELALFGAQPAHAFAGAVPAVWLSEMLHAGYLAFYLATFIPPLLLYARGEQAGFRETIFTLVVTWIPCCIFFALFPVQGPRYLWPSPPGVPDGPFRRLSMAILAAGSARGTAFPSLHMAASVSQTIMAWRWQPRAVAGALTLITILVGFGAVYAGYHYGVDMIAGAAVGLVTATAVLAMARRTSGGRGV